jgi:hypothetical protein
VTTARVAVTTRPMATTTTRGGRATSVCKSAWSDRYVPKHSPVSVEYDNRHTNTESGLDGLVRSGTAQMDIYYTSSTYPAALRGAPRPTVPLVPPPSTTTCTRPNHPPRRPPHRPFRRVKGPRRMVRRGLVSIVRCFSRSFSSFASTP